MHGFRYLQNLSSAMYGKKSAMYGLLSVMYGKKSAMYGVRVEGCIGEVSAPRLTRKRFVVGDVRNMLMFFVVGNVRITTTETKGLDRWAYVLIFIS